MTTATGVTDRDILSWDYKRLQDRMTYAIGTSPELLTTITDVNLAGMVRNYGKEDMAPHRALVRQMAAFLNLPDTERI